MSNKTLPVNTFVIPLALTGLIASANIPAAARHNDGDHLARLAQRQARIQIREDRRNARVNGLSVNPIPPPAVTRPLSVAIESRDNPYQNVLHNISNPSLTQNLHNRSQVLTTAGKLQNVSGGAELDLTSDSRSIKLGENLFENGSSVSITVGGEEKTLAAGAFVTPAEYVAVTQKLAGNQGLVLAGKGNAVGGDVLLSILSDAGRKIEATSLVVPEKVQAIGNFADKGDFRLTGQLNNFGSVVALSTNNAATEAKIGARSLYNAESGVISSVGSNTLASRFGPLNTSLDLNLDATDSFINLGTVSSAGNLTISSAQVVNAGGTMSAQGHVNLNSANIDNYGTIVSNNGNVNVDSPLPTALSVTNNGGTIRALNGAINVRTANFTDKLDTSLSGGDWMSQKLIINGGEGVINVNVGQLTGAVTAHAGSAFIEASTSNLILDDVTTTGDPIIKNTGDISPGSISTSGAPLAIIAGGSILATGATLDTSNAAGAGGSILLAAGVTFEAPNGTHPNETWITGLTSTGGNIDVNGGLIKSDGTLSAGDIVIAACPGDLFVGGNVLIGNISADGGMGANGNVTVLGRECSIFQVDNSLGVVGTGNTLISSFSPRIGSEPIKISDTGTPATSGAIISGSFALTVTTADPDPGDTLIINANVGGTLLLESPDDTIVQGSINANFISISGNESTEFTVGAAAFAETGIQILSQGLNDSPATGIDDSKIGNLVTNSGDISIFQERGKLKINEGAIITANEGDVWIQNLNTTGKAGKKTDFLEIGKDAQISALASTAGLGNVTIATGVIPTPPIAGKPFKNVTFSIQNGGAINWGKKVTLSKDDNISVTAKGAIVTFANGLKKKAFSIDSNVVIIADPPGLSLPQVDSASVSNVSNVSTISTDDSAQIVAKSIPNAPSKGPSESLPSLTDVFPSGTLLDADTISNLTTVSTLIANRSVPTERVESATENADTTNAVSAFVWFEHDLRLPNSKTLTQKPKDIGSARFAETAKLNRGKILFAPNCATYLETPYGTVAIDAGSMALVVADENALGVYDLHDGKKGSVRVTVDGKTMYLSPGHCTVVSNKRGQFGDVNPAQTVGYGRLNESISATGNRVFTAEFSTVHAATSITPLREIMQSKHPQAQRLSAKFLKTSAVLMHLGHQDFQLHSKATIAAWKK
ncbi:MAG: hypothetical protein K2X93_24615 [Candidatus Obscuribacterales bacterium]|nr:hypothetical protein [Candidatus Obscuribacterales bacterium]